MTDTVTLDRKVAAWLVDHALTHIWYASPDSAGDDGLGEDGEPVLGCCPRCCAPCSAVNALLASGRLDELAAHLGRHSSYWNDAENRVDRNWLALAWVMTDCHEGLDDD